MQPAHPRPVAHPHPPSHQPVQERAFVGESCCKWFSLLVIPPVVFEATWYLAVGPHFIAWLEHTGRSDDDCRKISLGDA